MPSMRVETAKNALPLDYIDAAWSDSPAGPRIILRPRKRGATISPEAFSLDLEAARMLSLHLAQFVHDAETARQ